MSRIQNQTGTKTFIQYDVIIEITYMYGMAFRNIHTKIRRQVVKKGFTVGSGINN